MDYRNLTENLSLELARVLKQKILTLSYPDSKSILGFSDNFDVALYCKLCKLFGISAEGKLLEASTNSWSEVRYVAPSIPIYISGSFGEISPTILTIGAALQLMHQSSVLFDDLQDQDQQDWQSGQPETLNTALILLTMGQETFVEALSEINHTRISSLVSIQLLEELLRIIRIGFRGQLLDLQEKALPIQTRITNSKKYLDKLAMKSGQIGSYLAGLGAILGNGSAKAIQIYRQFGFAYYMALHLLDDLGDFIQGTQSEKCSNDLKYRHPNITFIHAFEELTTLTEKSRFYTLWEQNYLEKANTELTMLLFTKKAFLKTYLLAGQYLVEAENYLRLLDPTLSKMEHQALITILKTLMSRLNIYFRTGGFNTSKVKL